MNDISIISVKSVAKSVDASNGTLTILEDIDLNIKPGETVAIVGPSGSGKSTLLSLLAGFDVPSKGTIEIDGQVISSLTEDERARCRRGRIGFVFQRFHLLPGLTALENVRIAIELSANMLSDKMEAVAIDMLSKVGLAHRLHHYPYQLSGGEQQRVALARAFVVHPKIIFLDEPTGNLDVHTGQTVLELLFKLNEDEQTTLVIVTHEDKVARRCGRYLQLKDGCLN